MVTLQDVTVAYILEQKSVLIICGAQQVPGYKFNTDIIMNSPR